MCKNNNFTSYQIVNLQYPLPYLHSDIITVSVRSLIQ